MPEGVVAEAGGCAAALGPVPAEGEAPAGKDLRSVITLCSEDNAEPVAGTAGVWAAPAAGRLGLVLGFGLPVAPPPRPLRVAPPRPPLPEVLRPLPRFPPPFLVPSVDEGLEMLSSEPSAAVAGLGDDFLPLLFRDLLPPPAEP